MKAGITEKDILEAMQRVISVDLAAVNSGWENAEDILSITSEIEKQQEEEDEMPRLR